MPLLLPPSLHATPTHLFGIHANRVHAYDLAARRRFELAMRDADDGVDEDARVQCERGLLFVGTRRKTTHALRIWNVERNEELELSEVKGLGGFGRVKYFPRRDDDNGDDGTFLLATGLGCGILRLWSLRLERVLSSIANELSTNDVAPPIVEKERAVVKLLGTHQAKTNTIVATYFTTDEVIVVSMDMDVQIQAWPIPFEAAGVTMTPAVMEILDSTPPPPPPPRRKARHVSKSEYRNLVPIEIQEEAKQRGVPPLASEWISSHLASGELTAPGSPPWTQLFPPKELHFSDSESEEEEEDELSVEEEEEEDIVREVEEEILAMPLGFGTFVRGDGTTVTGEWDTPTTIAPGTRAVIERSGGSYKYEGTVNSKLQPHGRGKETISKGDEVETYEGGFRDGKRHGFGTRATDLVEESGFFRGGKPHGLAWWTWISPACEEMPRGLVERVGPIRCVRHRVRGKFFDEFGFHRADQRKLDARALRALGVMDEEDALRGGTFCDMRECWACLEEGEGETVQCVGCGMKVHLGCDEGIALENGPKLLWRCEFCARAPRSLKTTPLILFDRHGEPLVIETAEDAEDALGNAYAYDRLLRGEEDEERKDEVNEERRVVPLYAVKEKRTRDGEGG